jgi:hypothetical protein
VCECAFYQSVRHSSEHWLVVCERDFCVHEKNLCVCSPQAVPWTPLRSRPRPM